MNKVSVLFNLRISGCELRDNYCVSFTQLFKKKIFTAISAFQWFWVPLRVFYRWCVLHIFSSLRRVFCVLNHKYIKWKCFLGILWLLSLISNYFCAFTAFVLLLYIYFSAILKIPTQVFLLPVRGAVTHYSLSINRVGFFLSINRQNNSAVSVRFYAYLFLVMNKLIKTQNS